MFFPQLTSENRSTLLKSHIPAEHPCTVSFLLDWGGSHYLKKNLGRHHVFGPSGSTFRQEPLRELESPRKRDGQKMAKSAAKPSTIGYFALWSLQILFILSAKMSHTKCSLGPHTASQNIGPMHDANKR